MRPLILALTCLVATTMQAQDYSGAYSSAGPQGKIQLILESANQGVYAGRMVGTGFSYAVEAVTGPDGLFGRVTGSDGAMGFAGQLSDGVLTLQLFNYNVFGQPDYSTAQVLSFTADVQGNEAPPAMAADAPKTDRQVFINRIHLDAQVLGSIESQYSTHIPDGRYWYDSASGAWGIENGPTVGFVIAGLQLPGPMPSDISGTGTAIFINGREIHAQDQQALQQLLGVTYPGSYRLDARGNLTLENGQFIVNLAAVSQQASGNRPGLTSGMGGTVGVDGSGGVLFYTPTVGGYESWSN